MPKHKIPSTWGICFVGNEAPFCDALDIAIASTEQPFRYVEIGLGFGGTIHAVIDYLSQSDIEFSCDGVDLPEYQEQNCRPHPRLSLHRIGSVRYLLEMAATKQTANFVFIDGCHGCQCVMDDFLAAERVIKPGGVVAFHDTDQGCQDLHFQPHCQTGIRAREAVEKLGLLDCSRAGWSIIAETTGDKQKGGHGCLFVQRSKG